MLDSVQSQTKRSSLLIAKYIEVTTMIYKYKNNILHRPGFKSNNWWLSSIIRDCFYDIDFRDIDLLYTWLITENENMPTVLVDADFAINSLKYDQEKAREFEENFDPLEEAKKFISDPLVPRGTVHYHIFCMFDKSKRKYTQNRELAEQTANGYFFDYFGIEEDDKGLIRYLDY
jgi:hypothetical protein